MNARIYDASIVLGIASLTTGAYLAGGAAPAFAVFGALVLLFTIFGALAVRPRN